MSGHSKWSTIKHKKGAADAKRGKVFSRMSKELMVAARQGGSDPGQNAALRTIIQKARSVNMPGDNIDRAIKKGAGELEGSHFEEVVYEGYVNGVGLIIVALTDNKNRAAAEIRHVFTRHGTDFATVGSVSRGFERKGQIFVDVETVDEDRLMEVALEGGADDVTRDGTQFEILSDPTAFADVNEALEAAGIERTGGDVSLVPMASVPVTDKNVVRSVMKFIEALEDCDDVQNVYSNMDVDDAIMEELAAEED